MFWNHIKISLRKIINDKVFSIIKILSLAISITCSILIFQWISNELSYDKFHPEHERIYRVVEDIIENNNSTIYAPICAPAGAAIKDKYPQVEYSARTYVWGNRLFNYEDKSFYESKMIFSEPDLLKIFNIPFIKGNRDDALVRPNTILITRNSVGKYFGNEDPIGKMIHINTRDYEITGIIEDCNDNSILDYEFIASLSTWGESESLQNWYNTIFFTYIKVKPQIDINAFQEAVDTVAYMYIGESLRQTGYRLSFILEPISEVHLNKAHRLDENIHGNKVYLYIFSIIGIFILIIGSVNFMNLSTSKNINNFKEIAIRKIVGGTKKLIISQFLIESIILSFIALNIALYTVEIVQTTFNNLVGKNLNIEYFNNWWILPGLILLGIIIGVLSGIYPSIYLSIVKPIDVFRNEKRKNSVSSIIRKGLVIIQFTISIALIIASFIIYLQVDFMIKRDLGFDKLNKVVLPLRGGIDIEQNYEEIKTEFLSNSLVSDISVSSSSIGKDLGNYSAHLAINDGDDKSQSMYYMYVDYNFIKQFEIEIIGGRDFDKNISTDISSWENRENGSFILNESAMKSFGWDTPKEALGQEIITGLGSRKIKVIGVVKDFHFMGLQNKIEPLILEFFPNQFGTLNLSINGTDIKSSLKFIENKWNELYPENPFVYYFINDDFNKHYVEEVKAGKLVSLFTIFGIFIACLGLYGLTLYSAEQRTKEIGIKKALGASVTRIVLNMSSSFMWLVLFSNIIAWPIVYIYMNKWLENFSYRINMPYWIYFVAGIVTLIIAQLTISIHAIIAANKNPIKALRYE